MIITIGMEKGGPGKTTIATNLAAMCVSAGIKTLLVDTDPQGTATLWAEARRAQGVEPAVTSVQKTGKCGRDIVDLAESYQVVIADAGGNDSIELRQCFGVADRCIMPLRPSQFDVWTMSRMRDLVFDIEERTGSRPHASILINCKEPSRKVKGGFRETKDTLDTVKSLKDSFVDVFSVLESMVTYRPAFWRAAPAGMSVTELPAAARAGKAAEEMHNLFKEIFDVDYATVNQRAAA